VETPPANGRARTGRTSEEAQELFRPGPFRGLDERNGLVMRASYSFASGCQVVNSPWRRVNIMHCRVACNGRGLGAIERWVLFQAYCQDVDEDLLLTYYVRAAARRFR